MKFFIAFSAICALAAAQAPAGGYHFGYNDGQSSRQEEQTADGVVRGAYSFIDANGVIQTVRYTSDSVNGYQIVPDVVEQPNLKAFDLNGVPLPVVDTPEVAAAKREHYEAVRLAGGQVPLSVPSSGALNGLPLPVVDTPEVAAAKQQHYEAIRLAGGQSVPQFTQMLPGVVSVVPSGSFDINGIPLPVVDTPEVAAAKQQHYEAIRLAGGQSVPQFVPTLPGSNFIAGRFDSSGLPISVTDTPEVAAAKYAHFQVYRQL